jgi:hypothetical protein
MKEGGVFSGMKYAGRWNELLHRALAMSPHDAFVRLVHAQSVFYMPGFIGGGKKRAVRFFERLRDELERDPQCGVSTLELDVWIAHGLSEVGDPNADRMRDELLRLDLPPLLREVLQPTS